MILPARDGHDRVDSALRHRQRIHFDADEPPSRAPDATFLDDRMRCCSGHAAVREHRDPGRNVAGYAQVMRVEPVYQPCDATRWSILQREAVSRKTNAKAVVEFRRAVKDVLVPQSDDPATTSPVLAEGCSMVPVVREYRRPIAYDVDYVYKGSKYRSRLSNDPGNRLRVRVSVTPQVPVPGDR